MMLKKRFDMSNYEVDRPLLTGKNKKEIGLMKDELGRKIMTCCFKAKNLGIHNKC